MAHRRKLAILAMFLHSKHQKPYQGTLGTQEPCPSMEPTGFPYPVLRSHNLLGPLKELMIFEPLSGCFLPFLQYTFSCPSKHSGTFFCHCVLYQG